MTYDDRSFKHMSSSLMRARIAATMLAGLYETEPTLLTSAVNLKVELPGTAPEPGPPYAFTFAVSPALYSGLEGARMVGAGKIDIAWLNPSALATMAFRGKGPFRRPRPIGALAVFPSWDRLVIAVSKRVGINSMEELIRKKPALHVSVANNDCVNFAIHALLRAHGLDLSTFSKWGGRVDPVVRPSNPRRKEGIVSGEIDMVIDEGVNSWGHLALEHGMTFLPLSNRVLSRLERQGFRRAPLASDQFRDKLTEPTPVVDFSGWPIVAHAGLPEQLAYHLVAVLEQIREKIPYGFSKMPPMSAFCRSTTDGPLDIPLHPGAERYYREKGYL